jgi:hypothetical protein
MPKSSERSERRLYRKRDNIVCTSNFLTVRSDTRDYALFGHESPKSSSQCTKYLSIGLSFMDMFQTKKFRLAGNY